MAEQSRTQFSPSSLQDLLDCRRRYYYRNRMRLAWPAEQAAPMEVFELHTRLGEQFHRLAQQYFSGVDEGTLTQNAQQHEQLLGWWQRFRKLGLPREGRSYLPEQLLAWQGDKVRLVAKYDLIEIDPQGEVTIYDWKTTVKPASKVHLAARMQTRVYPLLLTRVGHELTRGRPISPHQVRMVYWFAEHPDTQVEFIYSSEQQEEDQAAIAELAGAVIDRQSIEDFPLTEDIRQCRFCQYRSLCDRGEQAGGVENWLEQYPDEALDLEIDLAAIEEIEF